ncbi:MAG: GNAT family N-acetyltransferase, partial [Thermoproteota archaeon]|nr:GNAT family N-acetyltransferase [Thermoproteota archaeon]
MKIRLAKKSDKDNILQFCTDTFTWGDYIDRVFDIWYQEPHGELLVAEESNDKVDRNRNGNSILGPNRQSNRDGNNITITANLIPNTAKNVQPIALSHVILCPNKKRVWIEGIRVKHSFRRNKVATTLIDEMLQFGRRMGAIEASAIISINNTASRSLFEKKGFNSVSKWGYYNIQLNGNKDSRIGISNQSKNAVKIRIAAIEDLDDVWNYLQCSETYRLSGETYFEAWRWYYLSYEKIVDFIKRQNIIIIENDNKIIEGVAIINYTGYWDKTKVFQIVYLDSTSMSKLQGLLFYCIDLYVISLTDNKKKYDNNN